MINNSILTSVSECRTTICKWEFFHCGTASFTWLKNQSFYVFLLLLLRWTLYLVWSHCRWLCSWRAAGRAGSPWASGRDFILPIVNPACTQDHFGVSGRPSARLCTRTGVLSAELFQAHTSVVEARFPLFIVLNSFPLPSLKLVALIESSGCAFFFRSKIEPFNTFPPHWSFL